MSVEIKVHSEDILPILELEEIIHTKLKNDIEDFAWITKSLDKFLE